MNWILATRIQWFWSFWIDPLTRGPGLFNIPEANSCLIWQFANFTRVYPSFDPKHSITFLAPSWPLRLTGSRRNVSTAFSFVAGKRKQKKREKRFIIIIIKKETKATGIVVSKNYWQQKAPIIWDDDDIFISTSHNHFQVLKVI